MGAAWTAQGVVGTGDPNVSTPNVINDPGFVAPAAPGSPIVGTTNQVPGTNTPGWTDESGDFPVAFDLNPADYIAQQ